MDKWSIPGYLCMPLWSMNKWSISGHFYVPLRHISARCSLSWLRVLFPNVKSLPLYSVLSSDFYVKANRPVPSYTHDIEAFIHGRLTLQSLLPIQNVHRNVWVKQTCLSPLASVPVCIAFFHVLIHRDKVRDGSSLQVWSLALRWHGLDYRLSLLSCRARAPQPGPPCTHGSWETASCQRINYSQL